MNMADFDHTDFDKSKQSALDDHLLVKFFTKQVMDRTKSEAESRPIYRDVEYIDIKVPGSNTAGACRPARQDDVERFPRHYAAFKQRQEMPEEGTPLREWPLITRSLAEELTFLNVKTVEQLSQLADVHASNIMGIQLYKQKAQEWLAMADTQKSAKELHDELSKRDKQIEELRAQVEKMSEGDSTSKPETKTAPVPASKPKRRRRSAAAAT